MKAIRFLLPGVVLVLLLFSYETSGSYGLKIENCYLEEIGEEVLCGSFEVMENRSVRKGAKIRLNFIILPARIADPAPDPIFIFSGGPGVGSAAAAASYARRYEKLRWEREIVLVDQRGTGASHPLPCRRIGDPESAQTYLQDMYPEDYVKECRDELENRADLRYYHTTFAMDDIDDLREALGYERINIMGGSYGSYSGIVYMKYHPERVRSAFLGFIAMPNWTYSGAIAPNTEAALQRLLDDCAADPESAADYPELRAMLDDVLHRLRQGPATVPIINPLNGHPETVSFTYNNFITGVRAMLYNTHRSRWIPAFIHWAAQGEFGPIAEYTAEYLYWINQDIMEGMYLCVTCTETIPYIDNAAARAAAEGTFMGTYRLDQQNRACDWWVRGKHPDDFHTIPEMGIPTLILSGEVDPVTPPVHGEDLAVHLPDSRHVIIPEAGHGYGTVWENCLDEIVADFISRGTVDDLDTVCVETNRRRPFVSWQDYTGHDDGEVTNAGRRLIRALHMNTRSEKNRRDGRDR